MRILMPEERRKFHILIISGASGSGKTSTCFLLGRMYPNTYLPIIFERSRSSRLGEFGSRYVNVEVMYANYEAGLYTNIAEVTHGGMVAVRINDVLSAFTQGKIAVMEFPIEKRKELEMWFPDADVMAVELAAPSEKERLRRLTVDHKYTDERIEGLAYGYGKILTYRDQGILSGSDRDLVLITATGKQCSVVRRINQFMCASLIDQMYLESILNIGEEAVKEFLRVVDVNTGWNMYENEEEMDDEYIEMLRR